MKKEIDNHYMNLSEKKQIIINELNKGFFSLSFNDELEKKFLNYYYAQIKESMLIKSVILGIIIFLIFGILDYLIYPTYLKEIYSIRYLYATPLLIIMILLLLKSKKENKIQTIFSVSLLIAGISLIAMIVVVKDPTNRYYAGLTIVLLFAYIAVGLRFKYSLFVGWSLIIIYFSVAYLLSPPKDNFLISNIFFLIFFNIIGMISNFSFEKHQRKLFLLNSLLEIEGEELAISNKKLKELSRTDPLTKLANRRHFNNFYKKEWMRSLRYKLPISLIMIDIDFFKNLNDTYGHKKGDEILVKLAKIFLNFTRRTGDLASRYGGDEFLLILNDTPIEKAKNIANQIQEKIKELKNSSKIAQDILKISVSIGVASTKPTKEDLCESLIIAADKALYRAKSKGRNKIEVINL